VRKKTFIIIASVLLVILIIMSIILVSIMAKKENNDIMENDVENDDTVDTNMMYISTEMEEVYETTNYMTAMNYVNEFITAININSSIYNEEDENGNYVFISDEEYIKQSIKNMLSKKYIDKNSITVKNIWDHVPDIKEDAFMIPLEIGKYNNVNIETYIIHGVIERSEDNKFLSDMYIIINLDTENMTYSIEPLTGEYSSIKDVKIAIDQIESTIEANDNNTFDYINVDSDEMVRYYINTYKQLMLGYPKAIYDRLDEEYKAARFKTYEEFQEYATQQKEQIRKINIVKYNMTKLDDEYEQYICIDENNNYYAFKKNSILDYKWILDIYSIDLPEMVEQYNSSNEEGKVRINIQKIIYVINSGDYNYIYNKLDDTFKANNFKDVNDFKEKIKEQFHAVNEIESGKYEIRNDTYIYTINLKDATGEKTDIIEKNVIIQLKEGTDFVMSFNIQ